VKRETFSCHPRGSDHIANILESSAGKFSEPGALHLTRRTDLLDLAVGTPGIFSIYESRAMTDQETR